MAITPAMREGLVFMTFHFPDQVDTQLLTIDATDPIAGTAEYKAAAVRIEKVGDAERSAAGAAPVAVHAAP